MDGHGPLGAQLHAELLRRGLTVATAESLTGGALGRPAVRDAGCQRDLPSAGWSSYATEVKQSAARGVRRRPWSEHGVVSAAVRRGRWPRGCGRCSGADWAVSTTGVAGPDRQEGKPVGTGVRRASPGRTAPASVELHLDRRPRRDPGGPRPRPRWPLALRGGVAPYGSPS